MNGVVYEVELGCWNSCVIAVEETTELNRKFCGAKGSGMGDSMFAGVARRMLRRGIGENRVPCARIDH